MNNHSDERSAEPLGLVRYDAMCVAIAEASRVDEVKELRNRAKAMEVYAAQALNVEAERRCCEIRIRAERRVGEMLRDMKVNGQRHDERGTAQKEVSRSTTPPLKLADLGITRDQSSKWQQLADVPRDVFEREVRAKPAGQGDKPTTEGILAVARPREPLPEIRMDDATLWIWGRIADFERYGTTKRDPAELVPQMTIPMHRDCLRLLPQILTWLHRLEEQCKILKPNN